MGWDKVIGQRISAGGIVVQDDKVLLVHHYREDVYDFWVIPGGGIEGNEGIFQAAEREVREETNLHVTAERIAYFEEFVDEGKYVCKFWVFCCLNHGRLTTEQKSPSEDYLINARFFSRDEVLKINVFPSVLKTSFWQDLDTGFSEIKYLGYTT